MRMTVTWFPAVITMALILIAAMRHGLIASNSVEQSPVDGLTAILYSTQAEWRKGDQLNLVFAIINSSAKPILVDGRMSWPGNIDLWVKLPNGKTGLSRLERVKMMRLTSDDVVKLRPDNLVGCKLSIGPKTPEDLIDSLKHPQPGSYQFWVKFYGASLPAADCKSVSLRSNTVTVVVK